MDSGEAGNGSCNMDEKAIEGADILALMHAQRRDLDLMDLAQQFSYEFIEGVNQRPVYPNDEAIHRLDIFEEDFPKTPHEGAVILELLHRYGSNTTIDHTGGRYFGFVNGGVLPVTLATKWLSDAWDVNAGLFVLSPINAKLESVVEQWLKDIFSLPTSTVAGFVSGSSMAILCGLAAARYRILSNQGWDVTEQGLAGAPPIRIVLSEDAHGTVLKALAILGFGISNLHIVPADDQGRIDTNRLPELDNRTIVILQAGNVNSGAFDDFKTICGLANEAGTWVHVDGAFGLWAAAAPNKKQLTEGVEMADSWAVDGHKTLNTPYDSGVVLCRDPEAFFASLKVTGDYLQFSKERDGSKYTPELSRRARAIEMWAALKFLGASGLSDLIDGLCTRAAEFAESLSEHGFCVLNDVVFNQVLIACDSPDQTNKTLSAIQKSGVCWMGGTKWKGEPVIRISVCSWATTAEDIRLSVEALVKARESVSQKGAR